GRDVAVGALEQKFWAELVQVLGGDPALVPSPYDQDQWDDCAAWLSERFAARSRDEWAELFAGTDACVAPVLSLAEAPEHPHNRARQNFIELDGYRVAAPVPQFSGTPTAPRPVTDPGADTEAILDELGVTAARRELLRADRAIG
ncbi:MAG: CoA transferase, partial [Microlunatus sp.]|nr:CoA transferase [Microlunatus sp.]